MLTLALLRHAKSSWDDAALDDFDRPLNDRGREAATRIGALMKRESLKPDHILCSPALRTRQTLELAGSNHPALLRIEPDLQPRLYLATPVLLLRAIHAAPATARRLLVVGHNPGLHDLAVWLTGRGPPTLRSSLAAKLPTGALVVLTFETNAWKSIKPGNGHLRLFARPRDLAAE